MKRKLFIALCVGMIITGCKKNDPAVTPTINNSSSGANSVSNPTMSSDVNSGERHYVANWDQEPRRGSGTQFISLIEANTMIGSYLYSIRSERNQEDVRSYSVDADMLRAYLADSSVKNVKLMFAHTINYIRQGKIGQPAGYNSGALTIIIAGYNSAGDYVYHNGMVLDHITPCPSMCPPGQAASSFLY